MQEPQNSDHSDHRLPCAWHPISVLFSTYGLYVVWYLIDMYHHPTHNPLTLPKEHQLRTQRRSLKAKLPNHGSPSLPQRQYCSEKSRRCALDLWTNVQRWRCLRTYPSGPSVCELNDHCSWRIEWTAAERWLPLLSWVTIGLEYMCILSSTAQICKIALIWTTLGKTKCPAICRAFWVCLWVLTPVVLGTLTLLVAGHFVAVLPMCSRRLADVHSWLLWIANV